MSQLPSADDWRSAGLAASARGDWATAADYLNRYLARTPHDTATHYSLAVIYLQSGRADYAVQLLDGLVRCQPQNPDARFYRGCVFQQAGRVPEAVGDYQHTLQLNPHHPGAAQALQTLGGPGAGPCAGPHSGAVPPMFHAPAQGASFVTPTSSDSADMISLMGWGAIIVVGIIGVVLLIAGIGMVSGASANAGSQSRLGPGWLVLGIGVLLSIGVAVGSVLMTRREIKTL